MIQEKRRALGRGLEALLPSRPGQSSVPAAASAPATMPAYDGVREIPLEQIERNPYQTRAATLEAAIDDLAASIVSSGVLQPIVVRAADGGRFQIIAGERRWLASNRPAKATVPALVNQ